MRFKILNVLRYKEDKVDRVVGLISSRVNLRLHDIHVQP